MNLKNSIITFCILLIAVSAHAQRTAEKVFRNISGAVVRIYSESGSGRIENQGSGIILKSRKWLITNAHVLGSGNYIYAGHQGNYFKLDSVLLLDHQSDIMILRIGEKSGINQLKDVPDLKVFDSDKIRIGQRIYAIGSPLGFENTISEGLVSGIRPGSDSSVSYIQISAPVSSGSSGGAVVDARGRLLGITSRVFTGDAVQNINFAIPVNQVFEVFRHPSKNYVAQSLDTCTAFAIREYDAGHFSHSLIYAKRALQLNPASDHDRKLLHYMIGRCYLNLDNPDSAISNLQRAIESSVSKFAHYHLGYAWMKLKNFQNARLSFEKAIAADSAYADAYNGMVRLFIKRKQNVLAAEWLMQSATIKKENPETVFLTAKMLFEIGKHDSAEETLLALLTSVPQYAEALYLLADIYLLKGMPDKSFELQQKAFRIDPFRRYTGFD